MPSNKPSSTAPIDHGDEDAVVDMVQLEADIQKSAPRVMRHMNEDHGASLTAYALAFGQHPDAGKTQSAILTSLDTEGFWLELTMQDGTTKISNVLVPFDRRIQSAKELHAIAVDMHVAAFSKLGVVYKITSGYYSNAFKMMGTQAFKAAKKRPYQSTVLATLTVLAVAYGYRTYTNSSRSKRR